MEANINSFGCISPKGSMRNFHFMHFHNKTGNFFTKGGSVISVIKKY